MIQYQKSMPHPTRKPCYFRLSKSSQVFVYCVNVKEKTDYILILAVTDTSMIYREGT